MLTFQVFYQSVRLFLHIRHIRNEIHLVTGRWEAIVVHAKAGIGYHGVASSIPPSDLPTLSVVGEGEVTISIKQ